MYTVPFYPIVHLILNILELVKDPPSSTEWHRNQRLRFQIFEPFSVAKAEPSCPFCAILQSAPEVYIAYTFTPELPVYHLLYGNINTPISTAADHRAIRRTKPSESRSIWLYYRNMRLLSRSYQWSTGIGGNRVCISRTVRGRSSNVVVLWDKRRLLDLLQGRQGNEEGGWEGFHICW